MAANVTRPALSIAQRMQQIAARLGELYRLKSGAEFELEEQEREYDARLLAMTPTNDKGLRTWPGSNEEQRETARKLAEAGDEVLIQMRANLSEHRAAAADFAADIAALEAERRGLEWTVRAGLARMIQGGQDELTVEDQADAWADDTITLSGSVWPEDVFDAAQPDVVVEADSMGTFEAEQF